MAFLLRRPSLDRLRFSLGVGASLVLGASLAGVYLVPALTTLHHVSPDAITAGPSLDWRSSFVFASVTALLYGVRWTLYQYAIGLVVLIPLFFSAQRFLNGSAKDGTEGRLLMVGASAFFLATELSAPLWFIAKPLHFTQFCYRFLAVASVAGLLACAWRLGRSTKRETAVWVGVAATVLSLLGAEVKLAFEGQEIQFRHTSKQELFSDQNMVPAVRGPSWKDYGISGGFEGECERLNLRCETEEQSPQSRRWRISGRSEEFGPLSVRLPAFAFPTWVAVVNGVVQDRLVDPATGALMAELKSADSLVELQWVPLPEERIGWATSGCAATLLLTLMYAAPGTRRSPHAWGVARPRPYPAARAVEHAGQILEQPGRTNSWLNEAWQGPGDRVAGSDIAGDAAGHVLSVTADIVLDRADSNAAV